MKIFSLFKKKDTNSASVTSSVTGTTASLNSGDGTTKKKGFKSKKKSKTTSDSTVQIEKTSKYVKAGHKCMEAMNTYIPGEPQAFIDRINACYDSNDSPVILEDGEEYKANDCSNLLLLTHQSFPDFVMNYGDVKEIKLGDDFVEVEISAMYATGTHSGAPYTIVPGILPEIPPSGKWVENDEQNIVFTMDKKTAKIVKAQVIALGLHTGFAGFYIRAGGDVSPLIAAKKQAAEAAVAKDP